MKLEAEIFELQYIDINDFHRCDLCDSPALWHTGLRGSFNKAVYIYICKNCIKYYINSDKPKPEKCESNCSRDADIFMTMNNDFCPSKNYYYCYEHIFEAIQNLNKNRYFLTNYKIIKKD